MVSIRIIPVILLLVAALSGRADSIAEVRWQASVRAQASSGAFAPYMLGSWNYGKYAEKGGVWNNGLMEKPMCLNSRFSWGAGIEYVAGYGSAAHYADHRQGEGATRLSRQAAVRIQQLYAEIKYRGVYLLAGMKARGSGFVDGSLSSGDLVRSNNARPIPGVAAGFVDFRDIPLTGGWMQIDGEIMYGRFMDTRFEEGRFNYYSGFLDGDLMYTYKRCYFRTRPDMPVCITVGMQAAGEFGGYTYLYKDGVLVQSLERGFHIRDLWEMFFPMEGNGEDYYKGNTLGSWDFKARVKLPRQQSIEAYFQWPWEDGSGIGRRNGWDGLWGVRYQFAPTSAVKAVVLEYIDFTNQGGPIHWSPGDDPGTDITTGVNGGDNYYNNNYYGAYSNYGMSIGTPFVMAPIYNLNGFLEYMHNRARGAHVAVEGSWHGIDARAMFGYQKAGGMGRIPSPRLLHDYSGMVEASFAPMRLLPSLRLTAALAFDAGNLRGNNVGGMLSLRYNGSISLKRK